MEEGGGGGEEETGEQWLSLASVHGRALLIGVDYVGFAEHRGCVASVKRLAQTLVTEGFTGDVAVLVDDGNVNALPTRQAIMGRLDWLAKGVRPGHALLLAFSGRVYHAGYQESEGSGAIYPADHRDAGSIRVVDMLRRVVDAIPSGATLLFMCDARPAGHAAARLRHRLVSHPEGDETPRPPLRVADFTDPGKTVVVLSTQHPRLRLAGHHSADLLGALGAALNASRRDAEDHAALSAAKAQFLSAAQRRFPEIADRFATVSGRHLRALSLLPLSDLTPELSPYGVAAKQAGLIQNLLLTTVAIAPKPPLSDLRAPSLLSLAHRLRDILPQGVAPTFDSNVDFKVLSPAPFLPYPQDAGAFGVFPEEVKGPWVPCPGCPPPGNDVPGSPRLMLLADALQLASSSSAAAFCFQSPVASPAEPVHVFLKEVLEFPLQPVEGWFTYAPQGVLRGEERYGTVMEAALPLPQPPPVSPLEKLGISMHHRQRLFNFYQRYNPSKLPSVIHALLMFRGEEEDMFAALQEKYGPEPPDVTANSLPPGWVLAESKNGDLFYKHSSGKKQWSRPTGQGPTRLDDSLL